MVQPAPTSRQSGSPSSSGCSRTGGAALPEAEAADGEAGCGPAMPASAMAWSEPPKPEEQEEKSLERRRRPPPPPCGVGGMPSPAKVGGAEGGTKQRQTMHGQHKPKQQLAPHKHTSCRHNAHPGHTAPPLTPALPGDDPGMKAPGASLKEPQGVGMGLGAKVQPLPAAAEGVDAGEAATMAATSSAKVDGWSAGAVRWRRSQRSVASSTSASEGTSRSLNRTWLITCGGTQMGGCGRVVGSEGNAGPRSG